MISVSYALQQLERIMGMIGFPKGRDSGSYVVEMRKALEFARDELAAEQAITGILREFKRCPSVADLLEAVATESVRNAPPDRIEQPKYDCNRCQDFGYFGGNLPPHSFAGPWKWCDCHAAHECRSSDPNLVEEMNGVRDILVARFPAGKPHLRKIRRMDPQELREDRYFGEF